MSTLTAPKLTPTMIGIAIALLSSLAFGLATPSLKAVYSEGGNASFMIVFTTWVRAISLYAFCLLTHKKTYTSKLDIQMALRGGFFQSLSIICILCALLYLSSPLVVCIVFTSTLMLLFFSVWKKEVVLRPYILISTICAFLGVTFVLDIWHPQNVSVIGGLLAFGAAIATASRVYIYGQQTKTRNPAIVGAEVFLVAAALLSTIWLFVPPILPQTTTGMIWATVSAVCYTLGTFGIFYGVAKIGAFQFSLFSKIEPLATLAFSIFVFGEAINLTQTCGIFLVIGSLIAYQLFDMKQKNKS